jgi:hypothetical protein
MKSEINPVEHLKLLAEAVDADLAKLEEAMVSYVEASHDASRNWVRTYGQAGPIQMINRQPPDNQGRGAAVYTRAAVDRVVERALARARTGSDRNSMAMIRPKLAERHV